MFVYLDANASAPLRPEVREAMLAVLEDRAVGNASSVHRFGQAARARVDAARRTLRTWIGADGDIIFTGSGTEALALAMLGTLRRRVPAHVVMGSLEHSAVRDAARELEALGWQITEAAATADGVVTAQAVHQALRPNTALIAVQHANNETGVVQPVADIGAVAHDAAAHFLVDAVQSAGKEPLDATAWRADFVALAAHKLGGPSGVGALWKHRGLDLAPLVPGSQESGWRGGSHNLSGIVGFAAAVESSRAHHAAERQHALTLRSDLERTVLERVPGAHLTGGNAPRLANTSHFTFAEAVGGDLVAALDLEGYAVSAGSACRAGSNDPSPTLLAMGIASDVARTALRVSTAPSTTPAEIHGFVEALARTVAAGTRTGAGA